MDFPHIHICELTKAWNILFEQLGVKYSIVNWDNFEKKNCSCLIINRKLFGTELQKAHEYLLCGGYVLDVINFFKIKSNRRYVRTKIQNEFPFQNETHETYKNKFDYYSFVKFFKSGNLYFNSIIAVNEYDANMIKNFNEVLEVPYLLKDDQFSKNAIQKNGLIFSVGFNIEKIFLNQRSKRKFFYSENNILPDEVVSKKTKGLFRKILLHVLLEIHKRQNLKYQYLSYFPANKPIFCFRVDTDFSNTNEIIELKKICLKYGIKVSWFVHANGGTDISVFRKFYGDEIGIHTHSHKKPDDIVELNADINYVRVVLNETISQAHKIKNEVDKLHNHIPQEYTDQEEKWKNLYIAKSYAAPFGTWNNKVCRVIAENDFVYSSEFMLDYDNLAFHFKGKLQIPIHPICIGSFKRAKATDLDVLNYFKSLITKKYVSHEPIILYHHPLDGRQNVLEKIFEYVNELGLNNITMLDYANWWNERKIFVDSLNSVNNKKVNYSPESLVLCDVQELSQTQTKFNEKLQTQALVDIMPVRNKLKTLKKMTKSKWRLMRNNIENIVSKLKI